MKSIHNLKKQLEIVAKEVKEIKRVATDTNFEVSHTDLLNEVSGKQEFQTISYLLGKTLIDSKSGVSAAISTPRKLYLIYKLSQNKRSLKDTNYISELKYKNNNDLGSINNVNYSSIENFLERHAVKDKVISIVIESKDFYKILGIKNTNIISIIDEKNIYIDNPNEITLYIKSESLIDVYEREEQINLNLFFNIQYSKKLDIQILFEVYDSDKISRIDYKLLPTSKRLNIELSKEAKFLRLGLKIKGEGLVRFKDLSIKETISSSKKINNSVIKPLANNQLAEGISIIIPSYKGESTILDTLYSIIRQKFISLEVLEVIIIINGEKDNTEEIVKTFARQHPELIIRISSLSRASASYARNKGIKLASKKYTIFCDDDDMLSEEYLAGLYSIADLESVGFCRIHDLNEQGRIIEKNKINNNLELAIKYDSKDIKYFSSAITMMASKIIPTNNLKQINFNEDLRSGEDVVFFTEYFVNFNPKINIANNDKAYYIRRLRANSVSRQELSFDFNVTQRLNVINDLLKLITPVLDLEKKSFINSKVYAQCGFIVKYLKEYPKEYSVVHSEIMKLNISNFPYRYLQDKLSLTSPELLIISYCHPPFVDTSSVVTAKRIYEFNEICDVVCADMSTVRSVSEDLVNISRHLVRDSYVVNLVPSFGNWKGITDFTKATIDIVEIKHYEKVYSRSFWPASHFAAFEYKRKHPNVKWIAEFSDPVRLDIEGNLRSAPIDIDWVSKVIKDFNLDENLINDINLYSWCELIVYLFSDEIIFTCPNQREVMLASFPNEDFIKSVFNKSVIISHPSLPYEFYSIGNIDYPINSENLNLAYFGAFYKTRKLQDLINVLSWYKKNKNRFINFKIPLIHIFTEQTESANEMINLEGLDNYFIINPYVNYFDFLAISKVMDVLIVNDAKANTVFGINPYLPSKLSDYLGTNTKVWALYEAGSSLSNNTKIQFKSSIGDLNETKKVFSNILESF